MGGHGQDKIIYRKMHTAVLPERSRVFLVIVMFISWKTVYRILPTDLTITKLYYQSSTNYSRLQKGPVRNLSVWH